MSKRNTICKLDPAEIEQIVNKLVPLIAAPEDEGFFRGVLTIVAMERSSASFADFVNQLLKKAHKKAMN